MSTLILDSENNREHSDGSIYRLSRNLFGGYECLVVSEKIWLLQVDICGWSSGLSRECHVYSSRGVCGDVNLQVTSRSFIRRNVFLPEILVFPFFLPMLH